MHFSPQSFDYTRLTIPERLLLVQEILDSIFDEACPRGGLRPVGNRTSGSNPQQTGNVHTIS